LVRIPNTPTAIADGLAGMALASGAIWWHPATLLLVLASVAFYWAGMALNDLFDLQEDRHAGRPRPLVDGSLTLRQAAGAGWGLWCLGLLLVVAASTGAAFYSARPIGWTPLAIGSLLALAILAYNRWLKQTSWAPAVMGLCRGCNLLLGASLVRQAMADGSIPTVAWIAALGHLVFVTGFTIAARQEETTSRRLILGAGWLVAAAGLAIWGATPWFLDVSAKLALRDRWVFPMLILLVSLPLVRRALASIQEPTPKKVQGSIKQAIGTLLMLDASAALAFSGPFDGLIVCSLFIPWILLGRWYAST
jgi:4-hydroxybenzoate polyprenyltransferase